MTVFNWCSESTLKNRQDSKEENAVDTSELEMKTMIYKKLSNIVWKIN